MDNHYVELVNGTYVMTRSGIALHLIIKPFLNGEAPGNIAATVGNVTLEEVFGGLAFYLRNRETIDATLGIAAETGRTARLLPWGRYI